MDKRSKAYRDIVSAMPKPSAAIEEHLDGQDFRYMPERRCRVCSADEPRKGLQDGAKVRHLVDTLIVYPKDLAYIHRAIEPMMKDWPPEYKITYKSIRTHQKKHMPFDTMAMRTMVERWATEKGISLIDAAGRMVLTEEAWLEATAHIGWQNLQAGLTEPSWMEVQKAWERIGQIKSQADGEFDAVTLLAQLNTIIDVVKEVVPQQYWPQIVERLETRSDPSSDYAPTPKKPELPPPSLPEDEELFNELLNEQNGASQDGN